MVEPFEPCRKCRGSDLTPQGFIISRGGDVKECDCHIEWKRRENLKMKLMDSNISLSIIDRSFDTYIGDKSRDKIENFKKFINRFKDIGYKKSLYVYGSNGTQKTTIVQVTAKELLKQGYSVFYIRAMDLIIKNFGAFNPTEENNSFMEKAENSDLVIIDECFARKRQESVSDYQLIALRNYLKERLELKEKSTIFISNYSIEEIQKQGFDRGIYDLIKRNTVGKTLLMQDNYLENKTSFDIDELFN